MSGGRQGKYGEQSTIGIEVLGGVLLGGALGAGIAAWMGGESTAIAIAAGVGVFLGIVLSMLVTAARIRH
jgi:hypothetical protein